MEGRDVGKSVSGAAAILLRFFIVSWEGSIGVAPEEM